MSCTLLFSTTTHDHAVTQQRHAGLAGELAVTSAGPGLPAAALADVRATPGVRSAVGARRPRRSARAWASPTTSSPPQILDGGQGGGLDVGVTAGSLAAPARRHDRARRASAPTPRTPRSATACPSCSATGPARHATVVAIYTPRAGVRRRPARPRARGRPPDQPAARHDPRPHRRPGRRRAAPAGAGRAAIPGCGSATARRWPAPTDADRETNRWLGPLFVAIIFAFTSIAVVNTLMMIALQRGRELALLRLVGGTRAPGALDGTLGGRADRHDRARPRPGDRGHGAAAAQPRADRQPPSRTCRPASSRRSSASRRCSRCSRSRCRRGGRCARGRSRRSGSASSRPSPRRGREGAMIRDQRVAIAPSRTPGPEPIAPRRPAHRRARGQPAAARPAARLLLPTGRAPLEMYAALRAQAAHGSLPSGQATVLQLDEYAGLGPADPRSRRRDAARAAPRHRARRASRPRRVGGRPRRGGRAPRGGARGRADRPGGARPGSRRPRRHRRAAGALASRCRGSSRRPRHAHGGRAGVRRRPRASPDAR